MNLKQLGDRIRSARRKRGLTLKQLGFEIGVDHSQISRIERGENTRVSHNVQKLCNFLHIPVFEYNSLAMTGKAERKMRSLIQEWPQSEQMICDVLDSIRHAYQAGGASTGRRKQT